MTTKTETTQDQATAKQLAERNKKVQATFNLIVKNITALLKPFTAQRYRTYILVNHEASDKETNLILEFLCCFFTLTLSRNKVGYYMLYLTYDAESVAKFGARLYNRVLRQVFQHSNDKVVEDSVRINAPGNVQNFYLNRLSNGENDYTSIAVQEQD